MICAVSGSHGFIGSHLCEFLKKRGHKVIKIDRDGKLPKKIDYLFDLAAYGNLSTQKDPIETFNANVIRVLNMLSQIKKIKGIVLTSSSATQLPIKSYYSISKMVIEEITKIYDLPIVAIRPSTIVGERDSEVHLIPVLIKASKSGAVVPFVKEPTHDYLDVKDFVRGMYKAVKEIKRLKGKTINLSSGKSLSNDHIRKLIEKISGKKININVVKSLRSYDTKHWKVKPTTEIKWKPKISLEQTLRRIYGSF